MRDQYAAPAEYGSPVLLVESGPVNVYGISGSCMPNAVDWRIIHHHYTGLGKAHTSCETVHDFWVRARVYIDTFLSDISLGLNTVHLKKVMYFNWQYVVHRKADLLGWVVGQIWAFPHLHQVRQMSSLLISLLLFSKPNIFSIIRQVPTNSFGYFLSKLVQFVKKSFKWKKDKITDEKVLKIKYVIRWKFCIFFRLLQQLSFYSCPGYPPPSSTPVAGETNNPVLYSMDEGTLKTPIP
jgi:hypothetical protein